MSSEPGDPLTITHVIRAIASRAPVEWNAVESLATDRSMLGLIRELQVVAQIADLHADRRPDPDGDISPIAQDHADAALTSWGPLLVMEQVGSGTFGDVYRAFDPRLDREVALKVLRRHPEGKASNASTVVEEGRLMARVRHPNVVAVYGADRVQGDAGIWMEFVEGRTLEELLRQQGPFSINEAIRVGIEVCRALAAVHRAGLLHGDVKAHNVMRADSGRIVLMDFGAGIDLAQQQAGHLAGTALYLAPEQLGGKQATPASDLYSLGVLLYHLLTGAYPTEGTAIEDLRQAHRDAVVVPLVSRRRDLPANLVAVIDRALSPEPEQRGSAEELLAALVDPCEPSVTARASPVVVADASARDVAAIIRQRPRIIATAVLIVLAGVFAAGRSAMGTRLLNVRAPQIESIAVLPFDNRFDSDYQFLADGIADDIGNRLAQVRGVRVVSRQAAGRRNAESQSADDLKVRVVLVGSIGKTAAGLNVTVRVLDSRSGAEWATLTHDGSLTDLGGSKGPAQEIASAVLRRFWPQEPIDDAADRPASAYLAYLRGRAALSRRTEPSLREAVTRFEQAIQAEPRFAEAYAGLADAHTLLGVFFGAKREVWNKAQAAALEALRLDDRLAEAHTSLAFGLELNDHRWADAEASFKRAIALNPNYALAHHWYALLLDSMGRPDEALREIQLAASLEPFSAPISSDVGMILDHQRRYDDGIEQLLKTIAAHPTYADAHKELGWAYGLSGRVDQGVASLQRAHELGASDNDVLMAIGSIYASAGRRREAETILHQLERQAAPGIGDSTAHIRLYLGENDAALDALLASLPDGDVNILIGQAYDRVRDDPRYKELVRRTGLPRPK